MSKIKRNGLCPCGSGKKYKKCCLAKESCSSVPVATIKKAQTPKKILCKTFTDELFQPVRLYYSIKNKELLIDSFRKLECVQCIRQWDEWVINYAKEAANIGLKVSSEEIPRQMMPLAIAAIYLESDDEMVIDIRSIERAVKFVEFIDEYICRTAAVVTHAAIYNKLVTMSADKSPSLQDIDFDDIFNMRRITVIDPEKIIAEYHAVVGHYEDQAEAAEALLMNVEAKAKKPLPEVEKFPIHYYEDGIKSFETACHFRQIIAMEHFSGNKNFSFYDLVQKVVNSGL